MLCENGDFTAARDLLEQLAELGPPDQEAHFLMGSVHGQLGQFDRAIHHYRQAAALAPATALPQLALGKAYARTGQLAEAEAAFKNCLTLQPEHTAALLELARIYLQKNRSPEAEQLVLRAQEIEPESEDALLLLGKIHFIRHKPELAKNCLSRVLGSNPDNAEAHYQLGCLLYNQGQVDEAEHHLVTALQLNPDYLDAHRDLGYLHLSMNRTQDALRAFEYVLSIQPYNLDAIAGMAKLLDQSGELQKARDLLLPHIRSGAMHVDIGIAFANICHHSGECELAVEHLQKLLKSGQNAAISSEKIHFALGKLFDRLENYDMAFSHFKTANDLKPDTFNHIEHIACIDKLIRFCDWNFFVQSPRSTQTSDRPIFIVGMPRSGTTLTEQILASHPDVYGAGEIITFPNIIMQLPTSTRSGLPYPDNLKVLTTESLDSLAAGYLQELAKLNNTTRRITDKTLVNFLYLGLISLMFPKARIIHCIRDPRDTCLSIYFQNFDESHNYATRLENLGVYYNQYKRIMQHWKSLLDIPILEVRYEELVGNQEAVSRQLIEFAGLEWDERVLRFYDSKRSVVTASYDQVRQKIYTRSTRRWKNYESHIEPLVKALGNAI